MWKHIKNYEGLYMINKQGDVRSLKSNKILKHSKAGRGYNTVCLCKDKKATKFYVHRLVAFNFIPNPNGLPTVNHIDGNKNNNNISNLEWCSYRDNNIHALENNLKGRGVEHYQSKLTEENVINILKNGKGDKTYQEIANLYNVSKATIRDVLVRKTWKHINV